MRISNALVEKLLTTSGKVTPEQLTTLQQQAKASKQGLEELAIKSNLISEQDLTKLYAKEIDVPYIELIPKEIPAYLLQKIPERVARQYKVIYFGTDKENVPELAMEDPDDIEAVNFLQKQLGSKVKIFVAPASNIQATLDQYRGNIDTELTKVISSQVAEDEAALEEVEAEDITEDSPIAQTVNLVIEYAIKAGASDIHIEPREDYVSIRYRVDGVLREANRLPKKVVAALVSRIKILSNLKIDERRAPQDGRFKMQVNGQVYALRVSTLPIMDGEKVVMRILDESTKALGLEDLGYWNGSLDTINRAIVQPYGMILVTGPTGSGKSTSLFSILSILNKPSVNISTVEDPVEYRVGGANQTQVNPVAGMTFINGLRALLRQDPNIIMVGEIRDGETANLAVQAALTGHLVFSTLHTNNASTSLPRLLDMGVEPFLIASTVRAVVGQRLIRRLCVDCRESYTPDEQTITKVSDTFNLNSPEKFVWLNQLEQKAKLANIGTLTTNSKNSSPIDNELSTAETGIKRLWKAHDGGCDKCSHSGYKGRVGIYEVLENTNEVQKLIVSNATSDVIQQQAIKDGMLTMQMDGFIKALRGQTSIEEIIRVTREA
jgi:type IV pilus assembly protein PilB